MAEEWKTRKLWILRYILKTGSEQLWRDIQSVDDPYAYVIPYENKEEAIKRVEFVDEMLKKHAKMFNTPHPVSFLTGNLLRHKAKLNPEQTCLPGIKSDADEVREIDILVDEVCKDPKWFFDEVHHVGSRKLLT